MAASDPTLYGVIVVGGGPMGLSAAYQCAVKEGKKVMVIEQYKLETRMDQVLGLVANFVSATRSDICANWLSSQVKNGTISCKS